MWTVLHPSTSCLAARVPARTRFSVLSKGLSHVNTTRRADGTILESEAGSGRYTSALRVESRQTHSPPSANTTTRRRKRTQAQASSSEMTF